MTWLPDRSDHRTSTEACGRREQRSCPMLSGFAQARAAADRLPSRASLGARPSGSCRVWRKCDRATPRVHRHGVLLAWGVLRVVVVLLGAPFTIKPGPSEADRVV